MTSTSSATQNANAALQVESSQLQAVRARFSPTAVGHSGVLSGRAATHLKHA